MNAEVLYNGPLGLLAIPKNKEAAQALGTGTKWCTSAKDNNMFDHYNTIGPLYIWKDKSGDKFQFWINLRAGQEYEEVEYEEDEHYEFEDNEYEDEECYQIMDARDVPITPQQLKRFKTHPVLSKIIKQVEAAVLRNATSTLLYARDVIKGRWKEGEKIILKNPDDAMHYARDVIKGRWKEGEKIIMTNPSDAKSYAIHIIKGRWPEAEDVIAQSGNAAMRYAALVIKGRWRKAEPYIMKSPSAYQYALHVIKGRWPEAEPYIMKNPHQSKLYKNFLETLDEET